MLRIVICRVCWGRARGRARRRERRNIKGGVWWEDVKRAGVCAHALTARVPRSACERFRNTVGAGTDTRCDQFRE